MAFQAPRIIGGGQIIQPRQVDFSSISKRIESNKDRAQREKEFKVKTQQSNKLLNLQAMQLYKSDQIGGDDVWGPNGFNRFLEAYDLNPVTTQATNEANANYNLLDMVGNTLLNLSGTAAQVAGQGYNALMEAIKPNKVTSAKVEDKEDEIGQSYATPDDYAKGGYLPGKDTGDNNPALLEDGEYVLNRKAVAAIGKDKLDEINYEDYPRFQTGGFNDPGIAGSSGSIIQPGQVDFSGYSPMKKIQDALSIVSGGSGGASVPGASTPTTDASGGTGGGIGGDAKIDVSGMFFQNGGFAGQQIVGSGGSIVQPEQVDLSGYSPMKKLQAAASIAKMAAGAQQGGSTADIAMRGGSFMDIANNRYQTGGYKKPKGYQTGDYVNPYSTPSRPFTAGEIRSKQNREKAQEEELMKQFYRDQVLYQDDLDAYTTDKESYYKENVGLGTDIIDAIVPDFISGSLNRLSEAYAGIPASGASTFRDYYKNRLVDRPVSQFKEEGKAKLKSDLMSGVRESGIGLSPGVAKEISDTFGYGDVNYTSQVSNDNLKEQWRFDLESSMKELGMIFGQ